MAVVYLEPQDLSAAQAARILEFLNSAVSAEQIGARIELPGELDIGVRLGQRLLDGRRALGGRFSNLQQVHEVPLIGPERFTEICTSLLGLDPTRWTAAFAVFTQRQEELTATCEQLREQLLGLGAAGRVRLDLAVAPQPAWLGQPLVVTVGAQDAAGLPLADRRITVEAGLGELTAAYGFSVQRGSAITVRTGADGTARLSLRFLPIEPLTADQQAALEVALGTLDAAAVSPNLLREPFFDLAAHYQEERGRSLRGAMDIYARQWKGHFLDQLNPSNLSFSWPLETSVLRADCHEADGAGSVAQAVAAAQWKNWVGAWFEFLGEFLRQGSPLGEAFAAAKRRGAEGYRLVGDLVGEAHSFVATQRGLAAQWLSQRVVNSSVQNFLAGQLDGVDDATKQALFSNLENAAEQITPRSRGALAAVDQARADLHTEIQKVSKVNVDAVDEIGRLRDEVFARASEVQTKIAVFDADRVTLEQKLNEFGSERLQLNQEIAAVKADLGGVKLNVQDLTTRIGTRPG